MSCIVLFAVLPATCPLPCPVWLSCPDKQNMTGGLEEQCKSSWQLAAVGQRVAPAAVTRSSNAWTLQTKDHVPLLRQQDRTSLRESMHLTGVRKTESGQAAQ